MLHSVHLEDVSWMENFTFNAPGGCFLDGEFYIKCTWRMFLGWRILHSMHLEDVSWMENFTFNALGGCFLDREFYRNLIKLTLCLLVTY